MRDLTNFKARIDLYLARVGKTQALLADSIGLTPQDLNHRLGGKGKTSLNQKNVYRIVEALADWKAFKSRQEVTELFNLLGFTEPSLAQWNTSPLSLIPAQTLPFLPSQSGTDINPLHIAVTTRPRRSCPTPPAAPAQFGGRDEELVDLKTRLKAGQFVALTAIRGLGGIGKTTLALKTAHDLYYNLDEKIYRAVIWKEIKRNPNPLKQLLDWAYLTEPTFLYQNQAPEQLAQQVRTMLEHWINESCAAEKNGRTLVVLDDVWDDGLETVRLLKQACPVGADVLITTRTAKLARLLVAHEVSLEKLDPDRGVKLLLEYLPEMDHDALKKLSEVLDGHPLALAIAAKRVLMEEEHRRSAALLTHINEYKIGLPAGTPFARLELDLGEEKEENLTKALYYSYAELNEQEQSYFRRLGILPYFAPFDVGMLVAIWEVSEAEVKKPCDRLRLLSLLDTDTVSIEQYGGNWYRQHPLVQSYARALLSNG